MQHNPAKDYSVYSVAVRRVSVSIPDTYPLGERIHEMTDRLSQILTPSVSLSCKDYPG
jgi:hypothetical protein